jgi:hypothetical protein
MDFGEGEPFVEGSDVYKTFTRLIFRHKSEMISIAFLEQKKKGQKLTSDGFVVQSFDTLLEELGTRCRNRCRIQSDAKIGVS